jgi:indole-3-glycerol phosphate synthase
MGADAVLLIAAALDDYELKDFMDLSGELGLDALVEVHDEAEVERALIVETQIIGVNQRDLQTFQVDTARALRIGELLPTEMTKVAESGIHSPDDIPPLHDAGYRAILVGEYLVQSEDRVKRVAGLRTAMKA